MEKVFDFIFPSKCFVCNRFGSSFCYSCLNNCEILNDQRCLVCDKPSVKGKTHFECATSETPLSLFCAFIYKDKVRDCIKRSKYGSMEFSSLKLLSAEACVFARKAGQQYIDYLIVPIPLSAPRLKERGFNQSDHIGNIVSRELNLPLNSKLLHRTIHTTPQAGLSRHERLKNLSNVFNASPQVVNKKILLVDDIATTGATFLSASSALYKAGAREVSCFAVSKKL